MDGGLKRAPSVEVLIWNRSAPLPETPNSPCWQSITLTIAEDDILRSHTHMAGMSVGLRFAFRVALPLFVSLFFPYEFYFFLQLVAKRLQTSRFLCSWPTGRMCVNAPQHNMSITSIRIVGDWVSALWCWWPPTPKITIIGSPLTVANWLCNLADLF